VNEVTLFIPDPGFEGEKVEYIDGFGARLLIGDEGDDDWGGGGKGRRTASGRLRWEDEKDCWF
jgi:hypothetical protein